MIKSNKYLDYSILILYIEINGYLTIINIGAKMLKWWRVYLQMQMNRKESEILKVTYNAEERLVTMFNKLEIKNETK